MIRTLRARLQGWRRLLVPVTVFALMLSPQTRIALQAADGDLDLTFGAGGKVTTDFGSTYDIAEEIAVQPDGKIVVAGGRFMPDTGDFAVARYNADGSLDATFGTGGRVFTDLNSGSADSARAMALQADGKIVLAGQSTTPVSPANEDFAVVRYNSNGTLDTTFGAGGIVLTDFGAQFYEGAFSVAIDGTGKIVVGGGSFSFTTQRDFAIARYNPDGSLDPTFDVDGRVTTPISTNNVDVAYDVAIEADNRIVAAGFADSNFALARYNVDGSLAGAITTNFGGLFAEAAAVVIQPDGKVIAVGTTTSTTTADFALVRYNADGTPDLSFGTGGHVTTDITVTDSLADVTLQADGKILVTGRTFDPVTGDEFAVARYEADGTLDATFGIAGVVRTDIGTSSDAARGIAIQADGKILVAGQTAFGQAIGASDFAIVRYEGTPPPREMTFYLHGADIPRTADAFTMSAAASSPQLMVMASKSASWHSEAVMSGTFQTSATFEVTLPCMLGVGFPKRVVLSTSDSNGGDEQELARGAVGFKTCQTQTIALKVKPPQTLPTTLQQRRLKLTIVSASEASSLILNDQSFVRVTSFSGGAAAPAGPSGTM